MEKKRREGRMNGHNTVSGCTNGVSAGDCAEWREVHCEGGECKRSFVKAES